MRCHHIISLALLVCAPVGAQPFAQNKLEFSNWWLDPVERSFPNFATGNVGGDGLFKVVPRTVLERHGDHRITGYRLAFSIDDAYTGRFPVQAKFPGVQLYRTELRNIAGNTYEVPDLSQPVGPRFDSFFILVTSDAAWVVEVPFDPGALRPPLRQPVVVPALEAGQRAGLAIMVLAEPGAQSAASTPGVVLLSSFQERHIAPGHPSHSGSYDARTQTLAVFGTTGQPSATGEIYAALRFENPTLQLAGAASGGLAGDPQGFETHMGPGAYATDVGTRGSGWLGLYVQAAQYDPGGGPASHFAFPFLVSASATGPTSAFDLGGGVALRVDPADLALASLLVAGGLGGPLQTYPGAAGAGFAEPQAGVYASPRLTLRPDPTWIGTTLWLQALIVDAALRPVDTTNVVRWSLR